MTRATRTGLRLAVLWAVLNVSWAAVAAGQSLDALLVASGLNRPVGCKAPPDDPSRLFIIEKRGVIKILELPDHTLRATPFLDIQSRVFTPFSDSDERGLLGLAFHPNYASNGFFYVNYINNSGNTVIARYSVTADPNVADFGSELILLTVMQPEQNHNGGCLQFGPDGMLYASLGDGGGANDQHGAIGNGQALNTLLGKLLRLDVDAGPPYIPADNPFVGAGDPLDEIWAYGLRNPWRFSFDRVTGELYIGDVGQWGWEELDYRPASSNGGENYGWRCMEGLSCNDTNCSNCNPSGPNCTCGDPGLTDPIHVYSLTAGRCSIIGGYVYRGNVLTNEVGNYFFGDYCTGQVWTLKVVGGTATNITERTSELGVMTWIASFGEDASGELYIVRQNGTSTGQVWKIISTDPCAGCDDGFFCNGIETCVDQCLPGSDPCPGQLCRESDDRCVDCLSDADCDDGLLCTVDTCDASGACVFTDVSCPLGQLCDPSTGACVPNCSSDADCPAGQRCDLDAQLCKDCLSDADCTAGLVCDTGPGVCVECLNDSHCAEGLVCTSQQVCAECEFDFHCDDERLCTDDFCESGHCETLQILCFPPAQCDPADGQCKECLSDDDCPTGQVCDADTFACRVGCRDDSDCSGGMRCDPADRMCKQCLVDADCADDGLWCNGPMVCVDGVCQDGAEPCPDQQCDEKSDVCIPVGNAANGGLLYDNWVAAIGADPPQDDHPLWQFRPDLESNTRTGADTWRCKECHGWDYKGVDGQYGSGSHRTGFPGILGTTLSPVEVVTLLTEPPAGQAESSVPNHDRQGAASRRSLMRVRDGRLDREHERAPDRSPSSLAVLDGRGHGGVVNGHGYGSVLSESQINDLMAFVLDGGAIDDDPYIDPSTGVITGDAEQGTMNYMAGGCVACHGMDGTLRNFGTPDDPEWVGTVATENPWEFVHKVRFGQPGSVPQMPPWSFNGGTVAGIADLGRYVQDTFPVDCTEPSHCRGDTLCQTDECSGGRCVFSPHRYGDANHDDLVDINDIFCVLDGFQGLFANCTMDDVDIAGCAPDGSIDILDIFAFLDAFQGMDPCCQ